jgi:hypothetical protein
VLNPIEQNIANGMTAIAAFLTEATCGEACWHAREDVCRCSCGGKNHGCLRTADGSRPNRTAKIDGYRYELRAVGTYSEMHGEASSVNDNAPKRRIGSYEYGWDAAEKGAPARVKSATQSQFDKWPELKASRDTWNDAKSKSECYAQYCNLWPYLLWVKAE